MIQYKLDKSFTIDNVYDDHHNKIKSAHSTGLIQYWSYDEKNRVIRYIANDKRYFKEKEYIYDDKNHVVIEKRENGDVNIFYYDHHNYLKKYYLLF